MFSFAGLFNIVCLLPVFPLLHYLEWETFELPPTRGAWIVCGINSCITLSSDYLYVLAMLKTTPMCECPDAPVSVFAIGVSGLSRFARTTSAQCCDTRYRPIFLRSLCATLAPYHRAPPYSVDWSDLPSRSSHR
jgi:hypothetical protein